MADDLDQELRFFFKSAGQGSASLRVVRLEGSEAISQLFRFELILVSNSAEIDFKDMLSNSATLTIRSHEGSKEFPYHGELAEFEQLNKVNEFVFYRAVLVPKVSRLSLNQINEVYLNEKSIPEVIEQVLKIDITNNDFEMVLKDKSAYRKRSFICQHQESNLDFISRWMEFEGMYYFFEHGDAASGTDKLKILDYKQGHPNQSLSLKYCQAEDIQTQFQDQNVTSFICRQRPLPKAVIVQDFNYRTANLENLKATETVSDTGRGEVMFYGDNLRSNEEAKALAKVRAQELQARGQIFLGDATAVGLRSGYFLQLTEHYRDSFNAKYLITEVQHFGSQAGVLLAGTVTPYSSDGAVTNYRASFIAIPAETQFRPERVTPKPVIAGTMSGVIDSEGSGDYAEINEYGQYKVQLLYDLSDKKDNKGSAWIRMASPYVGSRNGMNFPLLKGAEVLLSFTGGDPDQPVIMSAVPNSENPNVVTSGNQNASGLMTPSGNELTFSDEPGNSGYQIYVPGVGVTGATGGSGSAKRKTATGSDSGGSAASAVNERSQAQKTYEDTLVRGAVKGYSYKEGYDLAVTKGGSSKVSLSMDASGSASMANKLSVGMSNDVSMAMSTALKMGSSVSFNLATSHELAPPSQESKLIAALTSKKKESLFASNTRTEKFFQVTAGNIANNPVKTGRQVVESLLEVSVYLAEAINIAVLSVSLKNTAKAAEEFGKSDYLKSAKSKNEQAAKTGLGSNKNQLLERDNEGGILERDSAGNVIDKTGANKEANKNKFGDYTEKTSSPGLTNDSFTNGLQRYREDMDKLMAEDHVYLAECTSLTLSIAALLYVTSINHMPKAMTPVSAFNVTKDGNFLGSLSLTNSSYINQAPSFLKMGSSSGTLPQYQIYSNLIFDISTIPIESGLVDIQPGKISIEASKSVSIATYAFNVHATPLVGGKPTVINKALEITSVKSTLKSATPGSILTLAPSVASLNNGGSSLEITPTKTSIISGSGSGVVAGPASVDITGAALKLHGTMIDIGGGAIKCIPGGALLVGDATYLLAGSPASFGTASGNNLGNVARYGGALVETAAQAGVDTATRAAEGAAEQIAMLAGDSKEQAIEFANVLLGGF